MKRIALLLVALGLMAAGPRAPEAPAATGASLCLLYCHSIYMGCTATYGRFDSQACTDWLDGCQVGCQAEKF